MAEARAPLRWRMTRRALRLILSRAARQELDGRALIDTEGHERRWLEPEIGALLVRLEAEAKALRPAAALDDLPSYGNRLMVEFAIYTVAADRALRSLGIAPESARDAVAAIGWRVYRRMLLWSALPARLVSRDPGRRLRWTLGLLLRFPFDAPGAPGYAVETRVEDGNLLTHFSHCPPQSCVRRLADRTGDPLMLEAFRQSWCRYDWAGADLIAGDGRRGHYRRPHTLSHGDPVCDMCWIARAEDAETTGPDG